jgi:CheY-like chemotaxis protein
MNKIITLQDNEQVTTISDTTKKRVLIVDDEPDITLTFKLVLENTGLYDVYPFKCTFKSISKFQSSFI